MESAEEEEDPPPNQERVGAAVSEEEDPPMMPLKLGNQDDLTGSGVGTKEVDAGATAGAGALYVLGEI
jgi:hypothetical protein